MTRVLAIDWDETWTADPDLFQAIARKAKAAGWRVYVVTNRAPSDPVGVSAEALGVEAVVYCAGAPKRQACRRAGILVDVWVDDNPVLVDFGQPGLNDLYARGASR